MMLRIGGYAKFAFILRKYDNAERILRILFFELVNCTVFRLIFKKSFHIQRLEFT